MQIITIRLPKDLDKEISNVAVKLRLSRSDIVRMALRKFVDEVQNSHGFHPYDNVKKLLGSISSGIPDLGSEHRKHLLERIRRA